jgi:hypothetical protein
VGKGALLRAVPAGPRRLVGTRSLSSGRPNGSGLWPARWQAPAGPVGFAPYGASIRLERALALWFPGKHVIDPTQAVARQQQSDLAQARYQQTL